MASQANFYKECQQFSKPAGAASQEFSFPPRSRRVKLTEMAKRLSILIALGVALALVRSASAQVAAPPLTATTVQLPTFGVAIDAAGVLSVTTFEDPTGQLHADRVQAARRNCRPIC